MLPYFPFNDEQYKMTMGVQALYSPLIEIDDVTYHTEITLKQELLNQDHEHYFQAPPSTLALQWDTLALLLHSLAHDYPSACTLSTDGIQWTWQNKLLQQETRFLFGELQSLPYAPLDWVGRQIQEDLLLLAPGTSGEMELAAGQLCFPNAWCLEEKIGRSFLNIHQPVPQFAQQLGQSSNRLLERLKVDRPVWRINWAVKSTSRLNLTPRYYHEVEQSYQHITPENAGERCYLRIERQALTRLPCTGGILFTIHTYQTPLEAVINNPEQTRCLAGILRTTPAAMLDYKGITPFLESLHNYLSMQLHHQTTHM